MPSKVDRILCVACVAVLIGLASCLVQVHRINQRAQSEYKRGHDAGVVWCAENMVATKNGKPLPPMREWMGEKGEAK